MCTACDSGYDKEQTSAWSSTTINSLAVTLASRPPSTTPTEVPTPSPSLLLTISTAPTAEPTPMPSVATCTNGNKDGSETDTDCGGGDCPPCADDKDCSAGSDCASHLCINNVCGTTTAPTSIPTPGPTYAPPELEGIWVMGDRNQTMAEVSSSGKMTLQTAWSGNDPDTEFAWSVTTAHKQVIL